MAKFQPRIVCQGCQQTGSVQVSRRRVKRGLSGGKVVAAFLTFGFSILFVGLSRMQQVTRYRCVLCGTRWTTDR